MRLFACAFVAGAWWLQQQAHLPVWAGWGCVLLLLIAALLGSLFSTRTGRTRIGAQFLLVLCGFGLAFYWAAWRAETRLNERLPAALEQQDVWVQGVVVSLPNLTEHGVRFEFEVEHAWLRDQPIALPSHLGLGWYGHDSNEEVSPLPDIQPGQRWQLPLRLRRPHGNANPYTFDYEFFLLEQGIGATGYVRPAAGDKTPRLLDVFVVTPTTVIERTRAHLRRTIYAALGEAEYAGVIVALVLGDQNAIPQEQWQLFSQTGITHLVSISGLHVTMVAGMFGWLAGFLWRRHPRAPLVLPAQKVAVAVAVLAALGYCLLAGWGVPAQRTFLMLLVVALALWSDRLTAAGDMLALAALLVVASDPWAVMAPGFWLSFAAVGLILWVTQRGPLESPPEPGAHRWRQQLREASRVQLAITLGLAPLTLLLFQQISVIGPVANALAIPLVSFLVTPLALLGAVVAEWLPQLLWWAHALFAGLMAALTWLTQFPWAVWTAPTPPLWAVLLAVAASVCVVGPFKFRWRGLAIVGWLPLFLVQPTHPQLGAVWLTAFDIGQGTAVLVETQTHRLLYDSGPQYSPDNDAGSRVLLPYLRARGIRALDTMMISHRDLDHSGGALSVLQSIEVAQTTSSLERDHPIVLASKQHLPCREGQHWQWDGVLFEVLHPDEATAMRTDLKPNAYSCVLKISSAGVTALLTGDIEAPQEKRLVEKYGAQLHSDLLLVPHHGSGTSSTDDFLAQVQPRVALFQLGYLNRYHHPKAVVWQRYDELQIERLRTDAAGALMAQWSPQTPLQWQVYRSEHLRYWYPVNVPGEK
ncbi:MAG: DNA internalization-related competence protein ComEC/Rec2 [Burkholderiaceae bacterium]|nr:MAG: DNA internalization-related competence protein ComEC/Rec2 [Burkholderiaceae bacterium]